jgi:outer membrane lipoprotein SlyB
MDKNEHVVVAVFEDQAAAEGAIEKLKAWDKASNDVKLGAIGLLYKDGDEVKASVGNQAGRGLKVGAIVGLIAGALTGGLGLAAGAAAGGVTGGLAGSFFAKSLNLNEEACNALGMELDQGRAAVVVMLDEYEVSPTKSTLGRAGGVARVYLVPSDAVDEAAAALSEKDIIEAQIAERERWTTR